MMITTKCLIIGGGPAGYTAAIYMARAAVPAILVEGMQPGGQLTTTTTIENFPGFPDGVDGNQLVGDMRQQAVNVGADVRGGTVMSLDTAARPMVATLDNGEQIAAHAVIVATGARAKYLGLDDEQRYAGLGVSACATCDGFFYRRKTVAVVGGGDTACEEAHYLSHLASKVYMIVRKDHLRASAAMRARVEQAPNIEILYNCNTEGLYGDGGVEGARLVRYRGEPGEERFDLPIDGFFLAIGHKPATDFLVGKVSLDEAGYIITEPHSTATSVPGVFAAGDVANPNYRQAVAAAGDGCRAALDAQAYINRLEA